MQGEYQPCSWLSVSLAAYELCTIPLQALLMHEETLSDWL